MKSNTVRQRIFAGIVVAGFALLIGHSTAFGATTKGTSVAQAQAALQQTIQQYEQLLGQLTGADKQSVEQALADSRQMDGALQRASAAPAAQRKAEVAKVLKAIAAMGNRQMATLNAMLPNAPEAAKAGVQGSIDAAKNQTQVASATSASLKPNKAPKKAAANRPEKAKAVKVSRTAKAPASKMPAANVQAPATQDKK